jgi:anaerobic selenocysteine-containing dehydrogenase
MSVAIVRHVKGCCPLDCQDSCAWIATVENGRVTGVKGAKDHPITRGVLCAKVRDYELRQEAPDRLLRPMRRVGPRGEGHFAVIGWNEALDEIVQNFRRIIAEDGPEALLPCYSLGSMGVVQRYAPLRLFHALGASRTHGSVCGQSAASLMNAGFPFNADPEETPEAKLVVLWGQNVLTTCHHQWHFIDQARKRGAKIIAIDPRATRTTRLCDQHVKLRPGSDAVLTAAIARHLFVSGAADLELADMWVADLDAYRSAVMAWPLPRAAAVTGLGESEIADVAEAFVAARPALIRAGIAPQQVQMGEAFVRGLSALAILGGHWRWRGGGLAIFSMPALNEFAAARPDLIPGNPRSLHRAKLAEVLETAKPPVKGLMVWSANPMATQIDAERLRRGMMRPDLFTVVHDHFLTDTARLADIVLPATTQFEHVDVQGAWGHHYASANLPAVAPRGEAKSGGELMRLLAERLGLDHPALGESDEEIAASALPAGWRLDELQRDGWRKAPAPRPKIAPLSVKLSLASDPIEPPPPAPSGRLQLLTPKSHYFLNSTFANMPRNRQSQGPPAIELNPADASVRGLADGAAVRVTGGGGSLTLALKFNPDVAKGIAILEGKWWREPADTSAPMNRLTSSLWSPAGQAAYNETYVTVEAG